MTMWIDKGQVEAVEDVVEKLNLMLQRVSRVASATPKTLGPAQRPGKFGTPWLFGTAARRRRH